MDLNRAGTGLLEVVTGPVFRSAASVSGSLASKLVVQFGKTVQQMLRQAGVCLGNLEAGHLRFDVNVSVTGSMAPKGAGPLGTRVEIKNLNSFAALAQAIDAEAERQIQQLSHGLLVTPHETRGFDVNKRETFLLRTKEGPTDYRFIREYDIPEINVEQELIDRIRKEMPPTLDQIEAGIQSKYGLKDGQVAFLMGDPRLLEFFENTVACCGPEIKASHIYNWITIELAGQLNKRNLELPSSICTPDVLANLLDLDSKGRLDRNSAKSVLSAFLDSSDPHQSIEEIAVRMGLLLNESNGNIESIRQACVDSLQKEPEKALQVAKGSRSLDYFIGPLIKQFRGTIKPQRLREILGHVLQDNFSSQ